MMNEKKNREFSILLSLILVIVAGYYKIQATVPISVTLGVALLVPKLYSPLTWLWFRVGEGISWVVTRCILLLLFFGVVTPISLVRRWAGNDPFRRRQFGKSRDSVFIPQEKAFREQDIKKQY